MSFDIILTKNFSPLNKEGIFFDLDGTLIKPQNGYKFYNSRNNYAWTWTFKNVKDVINSFYKKNFAIYIITNQLKYDNIVKNRIQEVIDKLNIECCALISTAHDGFRKPGISLLSLLEGKIIIGKNSFYCGDAMGGVSEHSDDDLFFAFNANLPFLSPKEVFIDKKTVGKLVTFQKKRNIDYDIEEKLKHIYDNYDGVFLIGLPGVGKTYLRNWFLKTFGEKNIDYLSNDERKFKWDESKKFVIIDNTNIKEKGRLEFQELYHPKKFATIFFDVPIEYSFRGIKYRCSIEKNCKSYVPNFVIHNLLKNLDPPKNPTLHLKERPVLNEFYPDYLN